MNILIGVAGLPDSGKDTVATHLVEEHGFYLYSLEDYLNWIAFSFFNYSKEDLWVNKTEESVKFTSQLASFCNDIDEDFFINKTVEKMREDYHKCADNGEPYCAVISDVSRETELKLFDRNSSAFLVYDKIMNSGISLRNAFNKLLLVKVECPVLNTDQGMSKTLENPLEHLKDKWDYLISNTEDLDLLKASVDRLVSELKEETLHDNSQREGF